MKTLTAMLVTVVASLMTACNTTTLPANVNPTTRWSPPSATAYLKGYNKDVTLPFYAVERVKVGCLPGINIACPPMPKGISYVVPVSQVPDKVMKYTSTKKGYSLPMESFAGQTIAISDTITLDLYGVDDTSLKELNSSNVEVTPAQFSDKPNELWYFLTPQ